MGLEDLPRRPSYVAKKKVFGALGKRPPNGPPYWLWRKMGRGSVGSSKKLCASRASLRKYSKALPCQASVPDFVTTSITPPPACANSAAADEDCMWNSCTDSMGGVTAMANVLRSVSLAPSSRNAFM